jgi:DNA-binding XRE family transcriptional regulator
VGGSRAVRVYKPPAAPVFPVLGERPRCGRKPRDFEEWKALRRWNKLPEEEAAVPGFLLRLAREEAGLTQTRLARLLGITQQAVARAERWSSNPTWNLLRTWAEACGRDLRIQMADQSPESSAAPR